MNTTLRNIKIFGKVEVRFDGMSLLIDPPAGVEISDDTLLIRGGVTTIGNSVGSVISSGDMISFPYNGRQVTTKGYSISISGNIVYIDGKLYTDDVVDDTPKVSNIDLTFVSVKTIDVSGGGILLVSGVELDRCVKITTFGSNSRVIVHDANLSHLSIDASGSSAVTLKNSKINRGVIDGFGSCKIVGGVYIDRIDIDMSGSSMLERITLADSTSITMTGSSVMISNKSSVREFTADISGSSKCLFNETFVVRGKINTFGASILQDIWFENNLSIDASGSSFISVSKSLLCHIHENKFGSAVIRYV